MGRYFFDSTLSTKGEGSLLVFPCSICRFDPRPYLPCCLYLYRELGVSQESRGWMQSLGVHGSQRRLEDKADLRHTGAPLILAP